MATLRIKYLATSVQMQMHLQVFLPESIVPPGEQGETPLRVLWLLHGEHGDCSDWMRLSMVEHEAQAANIALVMPNLDNSMTMDMAHGGYPYFEYLRHDLPRHVRNLVRVLSDRPADNFVAGVSTGGYGAVRWMLREPDMFAAAACLSGELDMVGALRDKEAGGSLGDDFAAAFGSAARVQDSDDDLLVLARRAANGGRRCAPIHLFGSELDESFDRNRRAAAALRESRLEMVVHEAAGRRGWPLWNEALRSFITDVVAPRQAGGGTDVAR